MSHVSALNHRSNSSVISLADGVFAARVAALLGCVDVLAVLRAACPLFADGLNVEGSLSVPSISNSSTLTVGRDPLLLYGKSLFLLHAMQDVTLLSTVAVVYSADASKEVPCSGCAQSRN